MTVFKRCWMRVVKRAGSTLKHSWLAVLRSSCGNFLQIAPEGSCGNFLQVAPPVITPDSLEIVKESERGTPRAVDQKVDATAAKHAQVFLHRRMRKLPSLGLVPHPQPTPFLVCEYTAYTLKSKHTRTHTHTHTQRARLFPSLMILGCDCVAVHLPYHTTSTRTGRQRRRGNSDGSRCRSSVLVSRCCETTAHIAH